MFVASGAEMREGVLLSLPSWQGRLVELEGEAGGGGGLGGGGACLSCTVSYSGCPIDIKAAVHAQGTMCISAVPQQDLLSAT